MLFPTGCFLHLKPVVHCCASARFYVVFSLASISLVTLSFHLCCLSEFYLLIFNHLFLTLLPLGFLISSWCSFYCLLGNTLFWLFSIECFLSASCFSFSLWFFIYLFIFACLSVCFNVKCPLWDLEWFLPNKGSSLNDLRSFWTCLYRQSSGRRGHNQNNWNSQ